VPSATKGRRSIGAPPSTRNGAIQDVMPDSLHLSAAGYDIWARAMGPTLQTLLAQP